MLCHARRGRLTQLDHIAPSGPRRADRPRGQLDDNARAPDEWPEPPRAQVGDDPQYPRLGVEVDDVDREGHPDRVDRVARPDDHALAGCQGGPSEQASGAGEERGGQVGPLGEGDGARDVDDPHLSVGHAPSPARRRDSARRPSGASPDRTAGTTRGRRSLRRCGRCRSDGRQLRHRPDARGGSGTAAAPSHSSQWGSLWDFDDRVRVITPARTCRAEPGARGPRSTERQAPRYDNIALSKCTAGRTGLVPVGPVR